MSTRTRLDRRLVNAGRRGPGNDWFKLTNLGNGTADIWIYDEIGYWGTTATDVVAQLSELNVTEINLHINSYGGEVFDGIAIYECLRVHPASITVYIDGLAASIASVIAMAGNKIIMGRNAQMMIHNASGGCWGTADDMDATATLLRSVTANLAGVYADRTGVAVDHWLAAMAAETWYFGHEAVTAGLADEVAPMHQTPDKSGEPDDPMEDRLSIFRFAGRTQAPPPLTPVPSIGGTALPDLGEDDFAEIARLLKEAFQ
jgi:ATP-dependent protease ClpP protease subunit